MFTMIVLVTSVTCMRQLQRKCWNRWACVRTKSLGFLSPFAVYAELWQISTHRIMFRKTTDLKQYISDAYELHSGCNVSTGFWIFFLRLVISTNNEYIKKYRYLEFVQTFPNMFILFLLKFSHSIAPYFGNLRN